MLDLEVTNASVKRTDIAGECVSVLTIIGSKIAKAHELMACVGEEVQIRTAGGAGSYARSSTPWS